MLDQIFLSTQLKQSVTINNRHGVYELPHELLNDLILMILGNWKFRKVEIELFSRCPISHEN